MKVKCNFCDNMIDETAEKCEFCGAPNERLTRVGRGVPKTIEELVEWYKAHNLPDYETTRFFLGIDYKGARAFGIYKKEDGNFVVYKNKADGSRAVRYEGSDETYAVNELYLKLKEEIQNQKNNQRRGGAGSTNNRKKRRNTFGIIIIVIAVVLTILSIVISATDNSGYYNYGGTEYYKHYNSWYQYDYYEGDWYRTYSVPGELSDSPSTYYQGSSDDNFNGLDIDNSKVSDDWGSDSDWDSGSSWDSGDSWDFGNTDWGSDW